MISGPCKGCTPETGRSVEPNCHMTCEKYLAYRKRHEEEMNLIYEAKKMEQIQEQITMNRIAAVTKERRRKKG